ncbi:hypothetical protein SOQ14_13785 [Erythrobacter sp. T5W1-R]|uniref:hypothetical protein n=1 Tax=Erythrobacter sp. T5W1-R TaxID=3101752 RepID=UPI002AFE462C|nr:hypothetical protein [Erythrobacter sp. T5W1-R]MEA1619989.1 hypothetical protein [Erythrobacter sp. T5W1-R]
MKRPARSRAKSKSAEPAATPETGTDAGLAGVPLPSTNPATNFLIADIVLRAAGDLVRERVERGMITKTYDEEKAEELVDSSGLLTTVALYGISRIATRSPAGLAIVAGGLVLKALYDRGKSIEARGGRVLPRIGLRRKGKQR